MMDSEFDYDANDRIRMAHISNEPGSVESFYYDSDGHPLAKYSQRVLRRGQSY